MIIVLYIRFNYWICFYCSLNWLSFCISGALCDLVPFLQFKVSKQPWRILLLVKLQAEADTCNFTKSDFSPWVVFLTFLKVYKSYQIAQLITYYFRGFEFIEQLHWLSCFPFVLTLVLAILTHFLPVFHFYTPWKQKTGGFVMFPRDIEVEHWLKMG